MTAKPEDLNRSLGKESGPKEPVHISLTSDQDLDLNLHRGLAHKATPTEVLTGWPTIAKYLGQPQAVAQRWAKEGMPVEKKGRSMTAKPEDLNRWLGKESGPKEPVHISQTSDQYLDLNLRRGLAQARSNKQKR